MVSLDIFRSPSGILKCLNVGLLIITVSVFYSRYSEWSQFVGASLVSAFIYTTILLLTYVLGGMVIQKTYYELLMNTFFAIMLFISSITTFVHANDWYRGSSGLEVVTGIFCLISFLVFAGDVFFSLQNMGVLSTSSASSSPPPQARPPVFVSPPVIDMNTAGSFPSSVINPSASNIPAGVNPSYHG